MLPPGCRSLTSSSSGAPFLARGTTAGASTTRTRFTPGRCAIFAVRFGPGPPLGLNTDTFMSDGFVLARNVGYDDWVRRAPAIAPMARPPTRPMRRTRDRYPGHRR